MVVSLNSANPGSFRISGPAIQASAVTTNTTVTRRSAVVIGPSARARLDQRVARRRLRTHAGTGTPACTSTAQATGISSSTVGMPNASHSVKLMVSP